MKIYISAASKINFNYRDASAYFKTEFPGVDIDSCGQTTDCSGWVVRTEDYPRRYYAISDNQVLGPYLHRDDAFKCHLTEKNPRKAERSLLFKHTFFGDGEHHSKQEIIDFLRNTDKPIKYTYGLGYRNPTTHNKPISLQEALDIVDKEYSMLDVDEYPEYVHLNAYSENDMW